MIHDEAKKSVKKREINLLVNLAKLRLHKHYPNQKKRTISSRSTSKPARTERTIALSLARLPNVVKVVDPLRPLVHEQRRGLGIGGLDPRGEQSALVGLKVEELIEVGVRDLLHRFNVVARNELLVRVEELDAGLLERALSEEQPLDARERLVRVVVRLFDESEFLALRLVETTFDRVGLLELLEREDEELGVVLVREGREGDRSELARFEPVDRGGIDGDGFLGRDVRLQRRRPDVSQPPSHLLEQN